MANPKKSFWLVLGLGLFAFLLWKLDLRQSLVKLSGLDGRWMALSLGLLGLTQALGYAKWKVMYRNTMEDKTQPLLPIFCSVLVTGMITPARTGDVVASMAWKKMQGRVLAWSIFHRISEGVTTIVLSFIVLGLFFHSRYGSGQWAAAFAFFGAIVAGIFAVLDQRAGRRVFRVARAVLEKIRALPLAAKILSFEEKIKEQFELFYQTLSCFQGAHVLGSLVFITLFSRAVIVLANVTLLRALGVDLPAFQVLGILAATWVSSFLSPTPSGIGIGDVAPTMMLHHYGFQESAGAYILMNRLIDVSIIAFWFSMFAFTSKKETAAAS